MDYSEKSRDELVAELATVKKELEAVQKALKQESRDKKELEFLFAERKKELNCHNLISHIFSLPNLSRNQVLFEILEAIPPSFQFPKEAQARIEINGDVYETPGYESTEYELAEPVFVEGRKIGQIIVSYTKNNCEFDEKIFLKEESDLLKSIAERIGNFLIKKDVEEKATESEMLYKSFIDASPDSITITDLGGNILFASPRVASVFGYAPGTNLLDRNIVEFIDGEYHPKAAQAIHRMFEGSFSEAEEYVGVKSDGSRFHLEVNGDLIRDPEGNPLKMIFITRDISVRKNIEKELVESERRLKTLISNLPGVSYRCVLDEDWTMLFLSEGCLSLTGYKSEVFTGENPKAFNDIIHPDDRDYVFETIKESIRKQKPFELEYHIVTATGEKKYVWEKGMGIFENEKLLFVEGLINDVTQRKQAFERLTESEQKYRSIFENIQDTYYEATPDGIITEISPSVEVLSRGQYTREEMLNSSVIDLYAVPEERELLFSKMYQQGGVTDFELLLLNKDGAVIPVAITSSFQFDESGKPERIVGILRDITERKKAEKSLSDSERELKNAQQIAKMGSWELNLIKNTIKWSENMYRLLDLNPYEINVTTEYFMAHMHKEDKKFIEESIEEAKLTRRGVESEYRYVKDNGEIVWFKNNFMPVFEGDKLVGLKGTNTDITDKKKAEQEILDVNAKLNAVVEAIPDLIFIVKKDGTFIDYYVKKEVELLLPRESIIGASAFDTFPAEEAKFHIGKIKECLQKKDLIIYDYSIFLNNQVAYYEARLVPFSKDSVLILSHDVTQRKQNEITITKLSLAVHQSPVMKMITDVDGNIEYVNPAFEKITGYSNEEVIGKNPKILQSKQTPKSIYKELWTTIKKGENWRGEWLNRKKSGEVYWEDISITPIRNKQSTIINYLAVKRDISEWKRAQAEITELTANLEKKVKERTRELEKANSALTVEIKERERAETKLLQARIEAEKANRAKSEFLSRMSHELRTPLNSILGFAQLLDMGTLSEKQKKGINHILQSGKHLLNLINEVLEISRIESGRLSLSLEPVSVDVLLKEITEILCNEAEKNGISMDLGQVSPDIYVNADKQKLKQVLLNFCANAVKYNKKNGEIRIKVNAIDKAKHKRKWIRISVIDTGTGIAKENLPRLFNPFERIGADRTLIEGSGLGLAVSKQLTEAMGGEIGVESTVNKGSTFWVELPSAEITHSLEKVSDRLNGFRLYETKGKGNILYIEDNESNIDLVEQIISDHRPGVHLHVDKLGLEGVQLAKSLKPDLILLDLNLPELPGDEIMKKITADVVLKDIPVIIVSADAIPKLVNKMQTLGAKKFLTKPLDINVFLEEIDKYIN